MQAGVEADTVTSNSPTYEAFYEAAPGDGPHDWGAVSTSDNMWSAAYAGSGQVYVSDFTSNNYWNTTMNVSSSVESAEFIVERNGMTQCNNPPFWACSPLAHYGTFDISGVKYQLTTQSWYLLDDSHENFWVWNLKNNSNQFLEYNNNFVDNPAGQPSGSSWQEVWHQGS